MASEYFFQHLSKTELEMVVRTMPSPQASVWELGGRFVNQGRALHALHETAEPGVGGDQSRFDNEGWRRYVSELDRDLDQRDLPTFSPREMIKTALNNVKSFFLRANPNLFIS